VVTRGDRNGYSSLPTAGLQGFRKEASLLSEGRPLTAPKPDATAARHPDGAGGPPLDGSFSLKALNPWPPQAPVQSTKPSAPAASHDDQPGHAQLRPLGFSRPSKCATTGGAGRAGVSLGKRGDCGSPGRPTLSAPGPNFRSDTITCAGPFSPRSLRLHRQSCARRHTPFFAPRSPRYLGSRVL
jgi:hypothetical protein